MPGNQNSIGIITKIIQCLARCGLLRIHPVWQPIGVYTCPAVLGEYKMYICDNVKSI